MSGFADLGEGEGLETSPKGASSRWKMRENPPVKVAGGLGRPFGGSGVSTPPSKN